MDVFHAQLKSQQINKNNFQSYFLKTKIHVHLSLVHAKIFCKFCASEFGTQH